MLTAEFFFCQEKVRKLSWTNIYPSKFLLWILIRSVAGLNPPLANVWFVSLQASFSKNWHETRKKFVPFFFFPLCFCTENRRPMCNRSQKWVGAAWNTWHAFEEGWFIWKSSKKKVLQAVIIRVRRQLFDRQWEVTACKQQALKMWLICDVECAVVRADTFEWCSGQTQVTQVCMNQNQTPSPHNNAWLKVSVWQTKEMKMKHGFCSQELTNRLRLAAPMEPIKQEVVRPWARIGTPMVNHKVRLERDAAAKMSCCWTQTASPHRFSVR